MIRLCRVDSINKDTEEYIKKEMYNFVFDVGSYFIKDEDIIIGMIDYEIFEEYVKIYSIQISDKYRNKGYGRKVINLLLKKKGMICGEATSTSVGFYSRFNKSEIERNDLEGSIYFAIFK